MARHSVPADLDLNLLRVLVQVHADCNVSQAAEHLGMSQPTVSSALKRLREKLGDRLFIPTARGMQATPPADQLAPRIGAALASIGESMACKVSFYAATSQRKFAIAMTDIGEVHFLPPLARTLRTRAPSTSIATVRNTAVNLGVEMEQGKVDLWLGHLTLFEAIHQARGFSDASEAVLAAVAGKRSRLRPGAVAGIVRRCMDSSSPHSFKHRPSRWTWGALLLAACCLLLAACGSLPRNATPAQSALDGSVPGFPDVRGWALQTSSTLEQDLVHSFAQESPQDFPPDASGTVRYAHLALSGGGANGAFGAGFLSGWTATGTRPTFKIVTGVSTGALMAPFAFIGPPYDQALREFYTTTSSSDIFLLGSTFGLLLQLISGEALADTRPLQAMIARHVDDKLLQRVAEAHQRGRRLYIGTANLDAPRFVVWNMGLIASSGHPDALALFRKVMLASASIPVAFPPVFFEVELRPGGPRYDEMHVDGGVGARVFLNGGVFRGSVIRERGGQGGEGREDIFVIHNGQLVPQPEPVPRSLAQIASRSIDATGRAAVLGDLFRIHAYAQRVGGSFHWVTIPPDVSMSGEEVFDPVQMQVLYNLGLRMAASSDAWSTRPPGQAQ